MVPAEVDSSQEISLPVFVLKSHTSRTETLDTLNYFNSLKFGPEVLEHCSAFQMGDQNACIHKISPQGNGVVSENSMLDQDLLQES